MKFVPRKLTNDEMNTELLFALLKEQTENDPNFISTIITGDESLVCGYDPEAKQRFSQWNTPKFTATQKPH
jgi:hypothetical protein